jgi:hypothetical protein
MESQARVRIAQFVLLLVLAGCPSQAPKDPAYTPAGPKPCERMADHVIGLMQVRDPKTGNPVEQNRETADAITRVLIETCTKDKWTQDAQKCWQELGSFRDVDKCAPLMTIEQRENFGRAMESALPRNDEPPAPDPGAGSGSN